MNAPDERLGRLLRQDSPPVRDAAFRIGVLERRERQNYQRRQRLVLVSGAVLVGLMALVLTLSHTTGSSLWMASLAAIFCLAVVAACLGSVRGMLLAIRHLRRR